MVLRRLLTFALAGMLMLETPAAAYAAGSAAGTGIAVEADGSRGDSTETDGTEATDAENSAGETSNSETTGTEIDGAETDNGENSSAEADSTENGDSENNGAETDGTEIEDGGDSGEETDGTEIEDGGDSGEETDGTEIDGGGNGSAENDGGEAGTDSEEDDNTAIDSEASGSGQDDTVSANDLSRISAAELTVTSADIVTELSAADLMTGGVEIQLPDDQEYWYSFTAPQAGRYAFYTEEPGDHSAAVTFAICSEQNGSPNHKVTFQGTGYLLTVTDELQQGEIIYIYTKIYSQKGISYRLKAAGQSALVKTADNSYSMTLADGAVIGISAEAGYRRLRFLAKLLSGKGSYAITPFFCPTDGSDHDQSLDGSLSISDVFPQRESMSKALRMGTSYETVYLVTQSSGSSQKFMALFTGADALTTKTLTDSVPVYIHQAQIEENRISLDIESFVSEGSVECVCEQTDGSGVKQKVLIAGWNKFSFENLKAGTEYRFSFREIGGDGRTYTAVYTTKGKKITASLTKASAAVSADFTELIVTATPKYNGTAKEGLLRCKFTDSLGQEHVASYYMKTADQKEDSVSIDLHYDGIYLKPGEAHSLELCLEFKEDHFTTEPVLITADTPKTPYVAAENVTFEATQNGADHTAVHYDFTVPGFQKIYKANIFYRPQGAETWKYKYISSINSDGTDNKGTIDSLHAGTTYEFLFSVCGVLQEKTLRLGSDAGICLVRQETTADFTGAYDFTRTYRLVEEEGAAALAGSCYLQLQYPDEKKEYRDLGTAVILDADHGYQAMVSSAERGQGKILLKPDTDYTLRWLVGKTSAVSETNAVCSVYEKIHTSKARITMENKGGSGTDQRYKVTLAPEDVANLQKYMGSISLYPYLRKKGENEYQKTGIWCLFSGPSYSSEMELTGLCEGTEYELSLRDGTGNTEYAYTAFTTASDFREILVTSVETKIDNVRIECAFSGFEADTSDYAVWYYREMQAGSAGAWIKGDHQSVANKKKSVFMISGLRENTTYEYRIGIGRAATDVSSLTHTVSGAFTTKKDERALRITGETIMATTARIAFTLTGMENTAPCSVICYVRKVQDDVPGEWIMKQSTYYGNGLPDQDVFLLEGLQENTTYEFSLGFGAGSSTGYENLIHPVSGSFTTYADERSVKVTSVVPAITSAMLRCAVSGTEHADNSDSQYLVCYVAKVTNAGDLIGKGEWMRKGYLKVSGADSSEIDLLLTGLSPETTYEYTVGFGTRPDTELKQLQHRVTGAECFTTVSDLRSITATVEPEVFSADVQYTLGGMDSASPGYVTGYLRKTSDGENGIRKRVFSHAVQAGSKGMSALLTGLEAETEYELTIGFGVMQNTGFDDLQKPQTITFTTHEDTRRLSGAEASLKETGVTLGVLFEGNHEKHPSYVHFFYREKGAAEYYKTDRVVNTSDAESRKCTVTLTGLKRKTAYEFAAVLSDSLQTYKQPEDVVKNTYKAVGEFTTGAAVGMTSIALSRQKLGLNVNQAYRNAKGYGYEVLTVSWSPTEASRMLIWESSNPDVVRVEDGTVTAVAPGQAVITVTSVYDPTVKAACEVTVADYQPGYKEKTGTRKPLTNPQLTAVRGGRYEGYGLCRITDGNPAEWTDYTVVSGNESVAKWEQESGSVTAGEPGVTKLVFESGEDHVKAFLTVTVMSTPGKGFAITGFEPTDKQYPAIKEKEKDARGNDCYILPHKPGLTYKAVGEIMPANPLFSESDFEWNTDQPGIATVDGMGNVTPLRVGETVLSVRPKHMDSNAAYTTTICEITLIVKEIPSVKLSSATPVYALADISKTIGDVRFPNEEAWRGWKWKEPGTPLVINGVNKRSYPFAAVYTGEEYYPEETTVDVYIAKLKGITATENENKDHNKVVEVSQKDDAGTAPKDNDYITLQVETIYNGVINYGEETNYSFDVDIAAPAGTEIQKGSFEQSGERLIRTFMITASRKGNYTLKPEIKVKNLKTGAEKVLAKTTYKFKAVDAKQAYIRLIPEPVDGVKSEGGRIIVDWEQAIDRLRICAEVTDRNQKEETALDAVKLVWSSTDRKVVTVQPAPDTRAAQVRIVGEGHAVVKVKAKDAAGHFATVKIEVQNHAPRVDCSKAKVNLAYDYDTPAGRRLAAETGGAVEILPVYGESVESVKLYQQDKQTVCSDLLVVRHDTHTWLIRDTAATGTGTYECFLGVKSVYKKELYYFPLQVTVERKQAGVTAQSVRAANLFYYSDPASVDIRIGGAYERIASVRWTDQSNGTGNGFSAEPVKYVYDDSKVSKNAVRYYLAQENILLTDKHSLTDTGIMNGTVTVLLEGYKEANTISGVSLQWNYKKPVIVTQNASATLLPAVADKNNGGFRLWNKTDGKYMQYAVDSYQNGNPKYWYNERVCENENVVFRSVDSGGYTYIGSKTSGNEKLILILNGDDWREPLNAVHTMKLAAPVPYLSSTALTVNTNRIGTEYTYVRLKNAYLSSLICEDILIQGKNQKAQALLDQDLLEIRKNSIGNGILVKVNRAQTMKQGTIMPGTYVFQITPKYMDGYGNIVQAKTLNLKIKVTDQAASAKTKAKGSLDLTRAVDDPTGNRISLSTVFRNIGSSYSVIDSELTGEYSRYFKLYGENKQEHVLTIAGEGELKAGQKYKLAVRYTIRMSSGDTFTVLGTPFTVRPKQTVPKVKVYHNNQTLYAAADTINRSYGMEVPKEYKIVRVEGVLDCDKDKKPDITVYYSNLAGNAYCTPTVEITDRDSVLTAAGAKGKTYSIPVTVKLMGRDGIAKDVKTSIKVTVKR